MKKLLYFFSLMIFLNHSSVNASHVIGGELTYLCLGNNDFLVTYTFYHDCFGIAADDSVKISIKSNCGFPDDSIILFRHPPPAPQITNLCPGEVSICNGGNTYGVEKIIYEGIITLQAQCFWTLSLIESFRNVPYVHTEPFYIFASLNNSSGICDTSPIFLNDPELFPCVGDYFCANPIIFDAEGDSIVCEMIDPMTSDTSILTYQSGYSLVNPLPSNPPLTFNSSTGELCFTPQQPFVVTIAFLVSSFRNGIPMGQIERDFLYLISPCTNQQPQLSGINGTDTFNLSICANELTCFNVFSYHYIR